MCTLTLLLPRFAVCALHLLCPVCVRLIHRARLPQVKTLSFLAYSLNRGFVENIKPHADKLPPCVLHLLRDTPPEAAAVSHRNFTGPNRKKLLDNR
jgi:hypothetical protein